MPRLVTVEGRAAARRPRYFRREGRSWFPSSQSHAQGSWRSPCGRGVPAGIGLSRSRCHRSRIEPWPRTTLPRSGWRNRALASCRARAKCYRTQARSEDAPGALLRAGHRPGAGRPGKCQTEAGPHTSTTDHAASSGHARLPYSGHDTWRNALAHEPKNSGDARLSNPRVIGCATRRLAAAGASRGAWCQRSGAKHQSVVLARTPRCGRFETHRDTAPVENWVAFIASAGPRRIRSRTSFHRESTANWDRMSSE